MVVDSEMIIKHKYTWSHCIEWLLFGYLLTRKVLESWRYLDGKIIELSIGYLYHGYVK